MSLFGNKKGYELSDVKVYRTKNYSIFKDIVGNRVIDQTHLANLEESVKERNWLANEPGMVNENGQLIDGQHRLHVAKAQKEWFYFTIGEGANEKDIMLLNTNSKNWTIGAWLNYYIANKYPDYVVLDNFARKYQLNIGNAASILNLRMSSGDVSMSRIAFRSGNFKVGDVGLAEEFMGWLNRFKEFCASPKIADRRGFIQAVWRLMRNEELYISDVHEKLSREGKLIFLATTDREYLHQIEEIFNTGMSKNRVRLY